MEETGKEEELQKFLGKVDEIDSIMKDLTCGDIERQNKALNAADEFLKRHKAENDDDSDDECKQLKTVCDRPDFPKPADDPSALFSGMERERAEFSQGNFVKAIEEDARERVKVRKKCEVEAEKLKGKGNMAFKEGKFQEAISNYTMAISKTRTNPVLYTNRAQAHIKLGAYGAAIQDCDLALGIDKKCVKAFVHKARALQAQGKFDEAVSVLNKATEVAPKQEKVLKGYIFEAESARKRLQDEQDATSTGLGNGELIESLISRLKKDGLATSQYMDATRTLASLLNSNVNRTLFRCFWGFQIIDSNKTFKSYWEGSDVGTQFVEDIDLICEVVRTLMEACTDNDHNVEEFFKKDHSTSFNRLLRDPTSPVIRSAVTSLLHQLSQTKRGRLKLVACKDIKWVAEALFSLVHRGTKTAVVAMSTINNLALQEGFCEKIRDLVDKEFLRISQRFVLKLCDEDRLRTAQPTDHWSLVSSGLSALANMAKDTHIRNKIADDQAWWETSVKFLDHYYHEIQDQKVRCSIYSILALLANISIQPCQYQKDVAQRLVPSLIELLSTGYDEIAERSIAALRHLLANSDEALNHACDLKIHIHLLRILKLVILSSHFQGGWGTGTRETVKKYAIKCLTLCTMERKDAREGVISEKALDYLLQMLHSTDETIIGNTALCLGHCADMVEVSQHFVGSTIVEVLLKHATNDELSDDVKQNAAICLARLATSDSRHLERLKEMHGLEILHSVIQTTNLS